MGCFFTAALAAVAVGSWTVSFDARGLEASLQAARGSQGPPNWELRGPECETPGSTRAPDAAQGREAAQVDCAASALGVSDAGAWLSPESVVSG